MFGQDFGDGGRQSGLAVVDVADGPDIDVWLAAVKLCFRHSKIASLI
jgi:hypothetical protein